MPGRIRWLAIIAGCFSGLAGAVGLGVAFLLVPSPLILGAAVQPRSERPGRWLMWVGAFLLSVVVLPTGFRLLLGNMRELGSHTVQPIAVPFLLSLGTILLVLWCDVSLVVEAMMHRPSRVSEAEPSRRNQLNWAVWAAAFILSAYCARNSMLDVRGYRIYGRLDSLGNGAVFAFVVLLLDVALIVHAIKVRSHRLE
jgi:hypothetical protein